MYPLYHIYICIFCLIYILCIVYIHVTYIYIYIISYTYHYASNYGMSIHFPTIFRVLPFAHHSFETVQSKRLILGLKR